MLSAVSLARDVRRLNNHRIGYVFDAKRSSFSRSSRALVSLAPTAPKPPLRTPELHETPYDSGHMPPQCASEPGETPDTFSASPHVASSVVSPVSPAFPASARPRGRRGAVALEFGLTFVAMTMLTLSSFDLVYPFFVQAALGHAARAGVDRALEPDANPESIRAAVEQNALGLLKDPDRIRIRYIDSMGAESEQPSAGGLVVVSVENVPAIRILSGLWQSDSIALSARAADLLP